MFVCVCNGVCYLNYFKAGADLYLFSGQTRVSQTMLSGVYGEESVVCALYGQNVDCMNVDRAA